MILYAIINMPAPVLPLLQCSGTTFTFGGTINWTLFKYLLHFKSEPSLPRLLHLQPLKSSLDLSRMFIYKASWQTWSINELFGSARSSPVPNLAWGRADTLLGKIQINHPYGTWNFFFWSGGCWNLRMHGGEFQRTDFDQGTTDILWYGIPICNETRIAVCLWESLCFLFAEGNK